MNAAMLVVRGTASGVCSPPKAIRWQETPRGLESRLNGVLIDRYGAGEKAGYPTLCKGRFDVGDEKSYYAVEEPTSLNTLELLPQLMKMGVRGIKIEGRQRSPAYVARLKTREDEKFLVLNGTQTQSARVYNLVEALADMGELGVDVVRLNPQSQHMAQVIGLFDAAREGALTPVAALDCLQPLMPDDGCNGYWHGRPGLEQVAAAATQA